MARSETTNTEVADQWQNDIPDGNGWSEMAKGMVGRKTQVVESLKIGESWPIETGILRLFMT